MQRENRLLFDTSVVFDEIYIHIFRSRKSVLFVISQKKTSIYKI